MSSMPPLDAQVLAAFQAIQAAHPEEPSIPLLLDPQLVRDEMTWAVGYLFSDLGAVLRADHGLRHMRATFPEGVAQACWQLMDDGKGFYNFILMGFESSQSETGIERHAKTHQWPDLSAADKALKDALEEYLIQAENMFDFDDSGIRRVITTVFSHAGRPRWVAGAEAMPEAIDALPPELAAWVRARRQERVLETLPTAEAPTRGPRL